MKNKRKKTLQNVTVSHVSQRPSRASTSISVSSLNLDGRSINVCQTRRVSIEMQVIHALVNREYLKRNRKLQYSRRDPDDGNIALKILLKFSQLTPMFTSLFHKYN